MNDITETLSAPADTTVLARLRARLTANAEADGLLDIAYTVVDSPVGGLLLAATEKGLVRVAYAREDHDAVLEALAQKVSPRVLRAPQRLDEAARELDEYFAGRRTTFDVPLDHALSHGFRELVQSRLPEIGYGSTLSYKQVAELVGNPAAVRAVGTACATNPLPVVVPCHRVVKADGGIGQYVGGVEAKAALLRLESAA
ncbi:methylated-DNA--[protein]-cysteine S-methyltransferase [Tsukamurella sputi]|uniref:Methylated-DNA--protein-cysteine methyltransferase n=1 Tax=Tsukamurella sputi TaxID=2591848 RepID=A0A5C5RKR0_9ACTN|nr:methylated-DNA--[protein]-cysteine S-methyltransferase [Tsukamurella sputi]TWS23288.1 methylated-DNA--[protein]-cysteine S-methyltransferase [Tsukamurella sputi]